MNTYGKLAAFAAALLTLPILAVAQNTPNMQSDSAQQEATRLVNVDASLTHSLDAKKVRDGSEVRVRLTDRAHMTDGTKLPSGTILIGHVVQDKMQQQGHSRLALRFDQAQLKDGKVIPIEATIVGLSDSPFQVGTLGNTWSARVLQVDQINALPGVDLHSRIGGNNSGVLVSTKKDDVKLNDGSQFELAIGPRTRA